MNTRKLVVVLGVHHSGISAASTAMRALGVDLGNHFISTHVIPHAKVPAEEYYFNDFNKEMLSVLGMEWNHARPVNAHDVEILKRKGYFLQGVELIRSQLLKMPVFSLADPSLAKLLLIWTEIFAHCDCEVNYVLLVQNPFNVAKSLKREEGLDKQRSYLMWLDQVLSSLANTAASKKIFIDYDRLLQVPEQELSRLALHLDVVFNINAKDYVEGIKKERLNVPEYGITELALDLTCPPLVKDIYSHLLEVASDGGAIGGASFAAKIASWNAEYRRMEPVLSILDNVCIRQAELTRDLTAQTDDLTSISSKYAVQQRSMDDLRRHYDKLYQQKQLAEERYAKLSESNESLSAESMQLRQALHQAQSAIQSILTSTSWKITAPVRGIKNLFASPKNGGAGSLLPANFNREWYLKRYPDVAALGVDPQTHFLSHGQAEGRVAGPDRFLRRNLKRLQLIQTVFPIAAERSGGVRPALKKAAAILKKEGIHGFKYRLINLYSQLQHHRALAVGHSTAPIALAGIELDVNHRYRLVNRHAAYTYIPPSKPYNFDDIVTRMSARPKFSILVPVYNTPPDLLAYLLESVQSQWYSDWELIFANDASTAAETIAALGEIADPKIHILNLTVNSGIAGATNAALQAATGDYIVLLDHDDELTEDCLFELAVCIERDDPDYIYSDEDKIDSSGRYTEPHFKPDWSPDTMMSTMFVCHVSCIRRSKLEQIQGLRSDYDGCQDWDMVLRLTELTTKISHIPKVLYHWRIIPASVASDIAAKPYVLKASQRVREAALERRGLPGTVEALESNPGYFRINYHVRENPLVSIIIPTRDNQKILARCISSILEKTRYQNYEILILDNGSLKPETMEYFNETQQHQKVMVIRHDYPFNFSELNNVGAQHANGAFFLFLNDDTEMLHADWLERLLGYAQLEHIGAVGAKLCYPDRKTVQHAGIVNLQEGPGHAFLHQGVEQPGYCMRNLLEYNWLAVTGACLMVDRKKFDLIGGFDENLPVAYNDVELCFRLKDAGFYNLVCQAVQIVHHESVSRGVDHLSGEKRARLEKEKRMLFEKHPRYFQYDPFHNINLHPDSVNFDIVG